MKYMAFRFYLLLFIFCFSCCFFCFPYALDKYFGNSTDYHLRKITLVFIFINYSADGFSLDDLATLKKRTTETTPFNHFSDYIAFYKVDISEKEKESFFKITKTSPYISVRSDFLEKVHKDVNGPYKLVIVDALGSFSRAELSSVGKFSMIIVGRNQYKDVDSFAKGFLHELGHSFGLRDECPSCDACRPGFPNCAESKDEAEKWWGNLVEDNGRVGYFQGCCGSQDYIRPTIASLMNNPNKARDFGPVNEGYLRRSLDAFLKF